MKVRFNSKFAKLTIIACYAPTEEAEEEEKDEFYEQLEEEIRTTPRHDVLMVIGDLNATVGEDNTGKERAMGTQGFECANNNGDRLSDLCVESRLVICGTLFMHRHRRTGEHPFGGSNRVLPEWRKQLVCHAAPPGRKNNNELLQCLFLTVVDRYPRRLYPMNVSFVTPPEMYLR